jgi:CBS domain-containing protein
MSTQRSTSVRVADLMSSPLVTCAPDVLLREVAAMMAEHRIHAVVVRPEPWSDDREDGGVISDLDLVLGVVAGPDDTLAGRVAAGPTLVVAPDDTADRAAELMGAHEVTPLLVAEPDGIPVGIVSALDIARSLAPPPPPRPQATSGGGLRANPGDRLVIRGHQLGELDRDAEILEARGEGGAPPFLVRWSDDGRESLLYPGSDAHVDRITVEE